MAGFPARLSPLFHMYTALSAKLFIQASILPDERAAFPLLPTSTYLESPISVGCGLAGAATAESTVAAALSSVFGLEQAMNIKMADAIAIVFFMLEIF